MTEAQRMRCLELAAVLAVPPGEVLKYARLFETYVSGGDSNAVSTT